MARARDWLPANDPYLRTVLAGRSPEQTAALLDYAEQHYADYFEAPTVMEGRGPTDLQLYAMEQQPAPV